MSAKPRAAPAIDPMIVGASGGLFLLGAVVSYSIASADGDILPRPFSRHLLYAGLGAALAVCAGCAPLHFWRRNARKLLALAVFSIWLPLVPGLGVERGGGLRWIQIFGFSLQPVEFAKLALAVYLADYCARRAAARKIGFDLIHPALVVSLALGLPLALQPDFGSVVFFIGMTGAALFLAGLRWRYIFLALALALAAAWALVRGAAYRLDRVKAFIDPLAHQHDVGYQQTQSLIAFAHGGLFGVGLGRGVQKRGHLPEAHNDFVVSVLAEELGMVGFLLVLCLFAAIAFRAIKIGREAAYRGEVFGAFYAHLAAFLIAAPALVNIAGNLALAPLKGINLPLVSAGGSSMAATLIALSILVRVGRENRVKPRQ